MAKMKFGLMVNGRSVEQWQYFTVRNLIEDGHGLALIIVNDKERDSGDILSKIRDYPYKNLLFRIYNRYIFRPSAKRKTGIEQLIDRTDTINCKVMHKGWSGHFSREDIDRIKAYNLDFIMRSGFNILGGDILNSARLGIWSFHHGDEWKYRGGPPGFWEIYNNDPVNGVILQRLTKKLDGGVLLKKGYYGTIFHSYQANIDNIYYESAKYPVQVCREEEKGIPVSVESKTTAKIYHFPTNLQMILFWLRLLFNWFKFHTRELFLVEDWNVGYTYLDPLKKPWEFKPDDLIWFNKKSKARFIADPFLFRYNERIFLFAEDFDYKTRRGEIAISEFDRKSKAFSEFKPAIREDFHLAFPFVFEHEGNIYCIPESFEKRQIRLYIFDPGKQAFTFDRILIDKVDAVDPTLLSHEGLWYLFFTKKQQPATNLYIYFSSDLKGEFRPHAGNPVKSDISSTRPAGKCFMYNGEIYRPAQDCSGSYGKKVILNRIVRLTPDEFAEAAESELLPCVKTIFKKGLHTFNFTDDIIVVDGKRFVFLWNNLIYQIKRKCGNLYKNLPGNN